ncbi:2-amino-4-hydroxy-6- hydroxymethyldihydropteridine diphosphokinase [Bifidobacterium biavatii DSM 23969]|uniref:2-amino-4-hydroxy-6-hydroxymethyldihydropteridine diphosphokinase n=1 Tax=Bifidobacterium biavatii DSM 23969 TaxID=1437608 RepID=A0A087A2P6_9BIFI|nr:2-amino-4-hydroxy-6- hydroxymethyldihydropteridine diphosphokinase [Bifidobacterium biavatii DSM 23969]
MKITATDVTLHVDLDGDADAEDVLALLRDHAHVDVIVHCDDPRVETMLSGARVRVSVASDAGNGDGDDDADDVATAVSDQSFGRSWPVDDAAASGERPASGDHAIGDAVGVDDATYRTAVISMDSTSTDAERLFRSAIVALDGIPGNQVDGISPLYHVSNVDGPDAMAAVMQITTKLTARQLIATLGSVEASLGSDVDLDLVDMPGVTSDEPDCRVPWPSAREHAAVLAPWMDMDPEARLGKDPVSFLLAMAPDAGRVGLLSDNWIIGGTL